MGGSTHSLARGAQALSRGGGGLSRRSGGAASARARGTGRALLLQAAKLLRDPGPLVEWALTAHHRRDWAEALKRWNAVRANFPDSGNAYSLGAAALRELGRLDEAEDLLRDAFERSPPDFSLFVERARIAEMRGDMTEAQQRWAALKAAFPRHSLGYTAEARALRHLGLMDAAEALLANALDLFPDDTGVGAEYAWLAQIARDWEGAVNRWEQLRSRHPDLPVGYSGGA